MAGRVELEEECERELPGRGSFGGQMYVRRRKWDVRRLCFFFSSRRRHTRFDCDWSSDVCSSDLVERLLAERKALSAHVLIRVGDPLRELRESERVALQAVRIDVDVELLRLSPEPRSEEHTSELQSQSNLVCRLLLEKKKT